MSTFDENAQKAKDYLARFRDGDVPLEPHGSPSVRFDTPSLAKDAGPCWPTCG